MEPTPTNSGWSHGRKQAGDAVKRGDILLEVETDKAVLEVESFAKGTLLKRLVEEGNFAPVGDVIAYIGDPEDLKTLEAESVPSKPPAGDKPTADDKPQLMTSLALVTGMTPLRLGR